MTDEPLTTTLRCLHECSDPLWAVQIAKRAADEIERLNAAISKGTPAGWKLVPVEPTPNMIGAAIIEADQRGYAYQRGHVNEDDFNGAYSAMIAAAPGAPK